PRPAKLELLQRAEQAARGEGDSIRQVSALTADSRRQILIANSDGVLVEDDQVRTRFMVQCVAVADTGMQTGYEGPGRTIGFELYDEIDVEEVARTSAKRAREMLKARPAPSGKLPVVLKKGAGGVLFHEACGHGLEADLVGKDASVFRGRVGEQVASPLVTLVDDGTYAREWGTYAIDDEGNPARRNTLIENGEITDPIRSANLIGNGPEVLQLIDAVGNDFDTWAGTCGKDGQGVPVSAGQPTLRVGAITIGGTAA